MKKIEDIEDILSNSEKTLYFVDVRGLIEMLKFKVFEEAGKKLNKTPEEVSDIFQNDPSKVTPTMEKVTLTLDISEVSNIMRNLEKVFEVKEQSDDYQLLSEFQANKIKEAREAYQEPGDKNKNLYKVAKILGFTDSSGRRRSQINDRSLLFRYLDLTMGRIDWKTLKKEKPVSKSEAYRILCKEYKMNSPEAARKKVAQVRKKFENRHLSESEREELKKLFKRAKLNK